MQALGDGGVLIVHAHSGGNRCGVVHHGALGGVGGDGDLQRPQAKPRVQRMGGRGVAGSTGSSIPSPNASTRKKMYDHAHTYRTHAKCTPRPQKYTRTLAHTHTGTHARTRTYRWYPDTQALKVEGRVGGVLAVGTGRHWRGHVVLRREAAGGGSKQGEQQSETAE